MTKQVKVHHPEYTHVLFSDLKDDEGHFGKLVPIKDVFAVMSETHRRPSRFVTEKGIQDSKIVLPQYSESWRKFESGTAWVMRVVRDRFGNPALEAGNASPFTVVSMV